MLSVISFILKPWQVNITDELACDKFAKAMQDLVRIFFSITLALGLSKFLTFDSLAALAGLILAYQMTLLSYWGWNMGIAAGAIERNRLLYLIDLVLVGLYWYMIQKSGSTGTLLSVVIWIYGFYVLWELFRFIDWEHEAKGLATDTAKTDFRRKALNALKLNLTYLGIFIFLRLVYAYRVEGTGASIQPQESLFPSWLKVRSGQDVIDAFVLLVIFVLNLVYRKDTIGIYERLASKFRQNPEGETKQ